jgi:hypothetical protein
VHFAKQFTGILRNNFSSVERTVYERVKFAGLKAPHNAKHNMVNGKTRKGGCKKPIKSTNCDFPARNDSNIKCATVATSPIAGRVIESSRSSHGLQPVLVSDSKGVSFCVSLTKKQSVNFSAIFDKRLVL